MSVKLLVAYSALAAGPSIKRECEVNYSFYQLLYSLKVVFAKKLNRLGKLG